jgi:hypothetical protein
MSEPRLELDSVMRIVRAWSISFRANSAAYCSGIPILNAKTFMVSPVARVNHFLQIFARKRNSGDLSAAGASCV